MSILHCGRAEERNACWFGCVDVTHCDQASHQSDAGGDYADTQYRGEVGWQGRGMGCESARREKQECVCGGQVGFACCDFFADLRGWAMRINSGERQGMNSISVVDTAGVS